MKVSQVPLWFNWGLSKRGPRFWWNKLKGHDHQYHICEGNRCYRIGCSLKERATIKKKITTHYHFIVLVEDRRRETTTKVQRLNLHQHLKEEESKLNKAWKIRTRGLHQEIHHLFVTISRRNATSMPTIGIYKYVHSTGRKDILRHLVGRRKKQATRPNSFKGRINRIFP